MTTAADVFENAHCDLCGCTHTLLLRKKDTTSYRRANCAEDGSMRTVSFRRAMRRLQDTSSISPRLTLRSVADIYARFWKTR